MKEGIGGSIGVLSFGIDNSMHTKAVSAKVITPEVYSFWSPASRDLDLRKIRVSQTRQEISLPALGCSDFTSQNHLKFARNRKETKQEI